MPSINPALFLDDDQELIELASLCLASDQRPHVMTETFQRYLAMRLMAQGLRDGDIRSICGVSDYFLKQLADDFCLVPPVHHGREHKRHGGCRPGVWSLCHRRAIRLEASKFARDWVRTGLPFTPCPNPAAFYLAYRSYRFWGWDDKQRQLLKPSACLSVLDLVHTGDLSLVQCLLCDELFIHPGPESQVLAPEICPFCTGPHKQICAFDGERRVLQPH